MGGLHFIARSPGADQDPVPYFAQQTMASRKKRAQPGTCLS